MKHPVLVSAIAHLVLLALLYLERGAREFAARARQEAVARERHDAIHRDALGWRELERRRGEREPANDAGPRAGGRAELSGAGAGMGRVLRAPPRLGRRDWFAGSERGPSVATRADERPVLAELEQASFSPGRVIVGPPGSALWSFVDSWYTIGPLPQGTTWHPPDGQVDLDAEHQGQSGAFLGWVFQQSSRPEVVPTTMTPYSVHYAYTKLRSDRAREVWLAFGADDAMKVWLNGQLVWDCGEHWRQWALDEGARRVALLEGYNTVLVRLENWPDHGAFSVAVRY